MVATVLVRAALGGWAIMLLLGVVWHQFELLAPLGFTDSVWLSLAVTFVLIVFDINAKFTIDQEETF